MPLRPQTGSIGVVLVNVRLSISLRGSPKCHSCYGTSCKIKREAPDKHRATLGYRTVSAVPTLTGPLTVNPRNVRVGNALATV